jgi:hypothetical protein
MDIASVSWQSDGSRKIDHTIKMRHIKISIICFVTAITGCASGVKYKDMASSIPPVAPDKGRIFFYRTRSMVGAAVQPSIVLDGEKVGNSQPGGFFYVDKAPGVHEIKVATEAEKTRSLNLALQEIKYVKTSLDFGFIVGRPVIDVMDPQNAVEDLPDLGYTGSAQLSAIATAAGPKTSVTPGAVAANASVAPTAVAQSGSGQVMVTPAFNPDQAFSANPIEKWDGMMSCDARRDNFPRLATQSKFAVNNIRAAYRARFAMDVAGNAARLYREPAQVTETLSGQIADNKLTLSGEGYRVDTPNLKWQIRISGDFSPSTPSYSGRGNMVLADGSVSRICELSMTRAALSSN